MITTISGIDLWYVRNPTLPGHMVCKSAGWCKCVRELNPVPVSGNNSLVIAKCK